MPVQHINVGTQGFVRGGELPDKLHVVHDGGQRGFDIVRNVRDELRFHVLAFHALLDRVGKPPSDAVEVLCRDPAVVRQSGGAHAVLKLSLCQMGGTVLQTAQSQRVAERARAQHHQLQKNQQKKDPGVPAYHQRIANRQIECQQDEQEYERPPDRGDCLQGGARAAEQPAERLPDSPQAYPDKRMPEYRSRFDAYRQTHGIPDE